MKILPNPMLVLTILYHWFLLTRQQISGSKLCQKGKYSCWPWQHATTKAPLIDIFDLPITQTKAAVVVSHAFSVTVRYRVAIANTVAVSVAVAFAVAVYLLHCRRRFRSHSCRHRNRRHWHCETLLLLSSCLFCVFAVASAITPSPPSPLP